MKTQLFHFSAKLRQYRHLAKHLQLALQDGSFRLLSLARQRQLLRKLKERLRRIAPVVPEGKMKNALAGLAILALAGPVAGQSFGPPIESPFGLPITDSEVGFEAFSDIDNDGDQDLFLIQSEVIVFYENTGTPEIPSFSAGNAVTEPFGIQTPNQPTTLTFVDLDNDGDLDIFLGRYDYYTGGGFYFMENTGTVDSPAFGPALLNPFGLSTPSGPGRDLPALADMDNDGDPDLFSFGYDSAIRYFENTGTPTAPSFAGPSGSFFGLGTPAEQTAIPVLIDLDGDGDYDLFYTEIGYYGGSSVFFAENTGNIETPVFGNAVESPFGIDVSAAFFAFPAFADIDNDGDLDFFANDYSLDYYNGFTVFYENLDIDVNYSPTSADGAITTNEDEPYFFGNQDFAFIDGDISDQLQAVEITALPTAGALTLNGSAVAVGQTIGALQLPSLRYLASPNEFGNDYAQFQFRVSDGTLWSDDTFTMTINVAPVNDFPASADTEVDMLASEVFTFASADFPYTDADGDPLAQLLITQTVTKGTLELNGTAVANGQAIPAAMLGQLTFTPVFGEEGVAYTAFQFRVSDGQVFSPGTATMTINITGPNATTGRELDAEVQLSPNPAPDVLRVKVRSDRPLAGLQYTVFDAAGREVAAAKFAQQTGEATEEVDVRHFAAGLYSVRVFAEGKAKTLRFVKG